jgi:antitoxin component YwqK of YwqJK toxin-antitoxin module
MKILLTILLIVFCGQIQAQKIETYKNCDWKDCKLKDASYISLTEKTDSGYVQKSYLANNLKLIKIGKYKDEQARRKEGYFYEFYADGQLKYSGKYVNNKLNGLYLSYYNTGEMQDSFIFPKNYNIGEGISWHKSGYMKDSIKILEDGTAISVSWFDNSSPSSYGLLDSNGNKNGVWKYYHKNGPVSAIESYNSNKLISRKFFTDKNKEMTDTTNNDRDALFKDDMENWKKYLEKKLYFPANYVFKNTDNLVVVVNFTITENGSIEDAFVSVPLLPEFDKIALSVIKKSPKWSPAIEYNRKVKKVFNQPINFAFLNPNN